MIATPQHLGPGLRRVRAPNPSPMTHTGTNSYLVGEGALAVIDPGPDLDDHLAALLEALRPGERITHILVTHAHVDHAPLARRLADRTGAPVLAYGGATSGRSARMQALAESGLAGGGEGLDHGFRPDRTLADGDRIEGDGWSLEALWTPGHLGGHLCFAFGDTLFTGDHVMGWASSLVSPPDGDLTAFMASCRRLARRRDRIYLPGHGDPVEDPAERLAWLISHRESRESAILAALSEGPKTISEITTQVYADTPTPLRPAAERNVFAHLLDLTGRGLAQGEDSAAAVFRLP